MKTGARCGAIVAAAGSVLLAAGCVTQKPGHLLGMGARVVPCPTTTANHGAAVQVTDAGRQPRRAIRTTVTASTRQAATVQYRMRVGEGSDTVKAPTTRIPVALRVIATCPQGYAYAALYGEPHVADDGDIDASAMKDQMKELAGVTFSAAMDRSGSVRASSLDRVPVMSSPDGSNPLNSIIDVNHASVGFPAQPVGVGATWSATRKVSTGGAHISLTTSYRLLARQGDTITVGNQITEQAKPFSEKVSGQQIDVTTLIGTGYATLHIDLHRLVGTGTIHMETFTVASSHDGDGIADTSVSMDTTVS